MAAEAERRCADGGTRIEVPPFVVPEDRGSCSRTSATPHPEVESIRVLLVDDHTLVRRSLARVLERDPAIRVVGEAADGRAAVRSAQALHPTVVVMDVNLPILNGIDATRAITGAAPDVRVLMLSMHADEVYVRAALQAGTSGYLVKDTADVDLIAGVRSVARGERYLGSAVQRLLVEGCAQAPGGADTDGFARLSGREREIVQLIAEGLKTREIALFLDLAPKTVETHRKSLMEKLDLHNVAQLVRFAVRSGVVR